MRTKTLLPIGRISKAHGIRGEVSVIYHADSPELLAGDVFLAPPCAGDGDLAPVKTDVLSVRIDHQRLLVRFAGVSDRTAAERLRGYELLVPKEALPPLDEGEAYVHQLFGLSVRTLDENGTETELGAIAEISFPAGQELWTIKTTDGRAVLFPAVPEFVRSIDLTERRVVIAPPPGLLELYLQ